MVCTIYFYCCCRYYCYHCKCHCYCYYHYYYHYYHYHYYYCYYYDYCCCYDGSDGDYRRHHAKTTILLPVVMETTSGNLQLAPRVFICELEEPSATCRWHVVSFRMA